MQHNVLTWIVYGLTDLEGSVNSERSLSGARGQTYSSSPVDNRTSQLRSRPVDLKTPISGLYNHHRNVYAFSQ